VLYYTIWRRYWSIRAPTTVVIVVKSIHCCVVTPTKRHIVLHEASSNHSVYKCGWHQWVYVCASIIPHGLSFCIHTWNCGWYLKLRFCQRPLWRVISSTTLLVSRRNIVETFAWSESQSTIINTLYNTPDVYAPKSPT